jgi:putative transposase
MPRLPRYILPGVPQHIIQRGNNRQAIFAADGDYVAYLEWLKQAAEQHGLHIHAYVLMTNHVHLLATPIAADSIGKTMQSLGRRYVQYFNSSYDRTGTLWEGRYRATVVDAESYFLACSRYIELNPLRAAMVEAPGAYRWSSYRCNALGEEDGLVTEHDLYRRLGRSAEQRQSAYRDLFQQAVAGEFLSAVRDATNKGWALGNERFRSQVEAITARRAAPLSRGRAKRIDSDP